MSAPTLEEMNATAACADCRGTGRFLPRHGDTGSSCVACGGSGVVWKYDRRRLIQLVVELEAALAAERKEAV